MKWFVVATVWIPETERGQLKSCLMLEHASNRVHASVITMRASTCLYSRRHTEIFHKRRTHYLEHRITMQVQGA